MTAKNSNLKDPGEIIKAPEDMKHGMGNCGVVAVAIFCGVPYQPVEDFIRSQFRKPSNWRGSTYYHEQKAALRKFNKGRSSAFRVERPIALSTWVRRYQKPGMTYMIWTTGHLQTVRDGFVSDQSGVHPIATYWGRAKRVNKGIARK